MGTKPFPGEAFLRFSRTITITTTSMMTMAAAAPPPMAAALTPLISSGGFVGLKGGSENKQEVHKKPERTL